MICIQDENSKHTQSYCTDLSNKCDYPSLVKKRQPINGSLANRSLNNEKGEELLGNICFST